MVSLLEVLVISDGADPRFKVNKGVTKHTFLPRNRARRCERYISRQAGRHLCP